MGAFEFAAEINGVVFVLGAFILLSRINALERGV